MQSHTTSRRNAVEVNNIQEKIKSVSDCYSHRNLSVLSDNEGFAKVYEVRTRS